MTKQSQDPAPADSTEEPMLTPAAAAKLVFREKPVFDEAGKPTDKTRKVAIRADEVLSHRDYGTHVVVVTTDGQKFSGEKSAK